MSVRARESARTTLEWKCYGLTTADRPTRQAHLGAELERVALPFEVLVSQRPTDAGGFSSIGFRGCFESHLRAMRTALDDGVDVAIFVEDDAVIASRFLELLPEIQRELVGLDWSVLLLGYLGDQSPGRHFPIEQVSTHVARAHHWEFTGSHFVAVNSRYLGALIEHFESRLRPGGHRISVDGILNEFRHSSGHPTLLAVPNLSRQGPSPQRPHSPRQAPEPRTRARSETRRRQTPRFRPERTPMFRRLPHRPASTNPRIETEEPREPKRV